MPGGGNCVFSAAASNTSSTYQLTDGDVGSTMRVEVWAFRTPTARPVRWSRRRPWWCCRSRRRTSSAPSIAGDLTQGQTLTEVHGGWSNNPSGYAIQWEDCTATGANCTPILGATGPSYTLAAHDAGHAIAVLESASNVGGTATAVSSPTTAPIASSGPGTAAHQIAPKAQSPAGRSPGRPKSARR